MLRTGILILPEFRWEDARSKWQRAEALGFHHAWTYDHIAWSTLRDSTWFAAVPTLTAAALVTTTIRLGTLVASPNFRHPVPFARECITLDDVSAGRCTIGIGAGGFGWDATVLGQDAWSVAERSARFAEFVMLFDRLLREPNTTYEGEYWSAHDAPMQPGCVQRPRLPLAIAASGPRAMRVVARYGDAWVTNGDRASDGARLGAADGAKVVQRQVELLEHACELEGRDPATIDRLVLTGSRLDSGLASPAAFDDTRAAYADIGMTDFVVHWPRPTDPYAGDETVLDRLTV